MSNLNLVRRLTLTVITVSGFVALSAAARAEGVIGGLIERGCGGCGIGRMLDGVNANGRPFENLVVRPTLNWIAPGAGNAFVQAQRFQDRLQNMPRQVFTPGAGAFTSGGFGALSGLNPGRFASTIRTR